MVDQNRPTPENITPAEFEDALGRYVELIETVSTAKGAKTGQKTLAELDQYRYVEAPELFKAQKRPMQLADVKTLVEWKLRHGKFRPTLMKLVSLNEDSSAQDTIKEALELYEEKSDASAVVQVLTKLKGIGPATASLLLAVHDPDNVIFFADEAFYWLCCKGKKDSIKYNAKEYKELDVASQKVLKRLGTKAIDIERVAYVLMNEDSSAAKDTAPSKPQAEDKKTAVKPDKAVPSKRKQNQVDGKDDTAPGVRRSKRGKLS